MRTHPTRGVITANTKPSASIPIAHLQTESPTATFDDFAAEHACPECARFFRAHLAAVNEFLRIKKLFVRGHNVAAAESAKTQTFRRLVEHQVASGHPVIGPDGCLIDDPGHSVDASTAEVALARSENVASNSSVTEAA